MSKKTAWISIVLLLAGITIYIFSMVLLPTQDMLIIPKGYVKIATVNMSEEHKNNEIYKLDVKDTQRFGYYVWTNAKENKTLMLEGEENTKIGLLTEKLKLTNAEFDLKPGQYSITLTNETQPGSLVIYMLQKNSGQN